MVLRHRNPLFEKVEEDPEYEVRKVLSEIDWDGELPIDLNQVCDIYDFPYEFKPIPDMPEPGKTKLYDGELCIIINTHGHDCSNDFSSKPTARRRQRFTFAHEIGHCVYPSHQDIALQRNLSNPDNPHSPTYIKMRENQANQFAAHILVPRQAFKRVVSNDAWDNITKLVPLVVEKFDVSFQVAIQQTARLAEFPCMAILFGTDQKPRRVPVRSPDFEDTNLFYSRNQEAPSSTLVASMLSGRTQDRQGRKRYSDASAWFPDAASWKAEKFSIVETSFNLGKYGVATFLGFTELESY